MTARQKRRRARRGRESTREYYHFLKSLGLCPKCKQSAPPGKTYCVRCCRAITVASQPTHAERRARWINKRKARGVCIICGKNKPASPKAGPSVGKAGVSCFRCRAKKRPWQVAYMHRTGRSKGPMQKCGVCGTPGHRRSTCPRVNFDELAPFNALRIDDYAAARQEAA